jgi:hypothetical protein
MDFNSLEDRVLIGYAAQDRSLTKHAGYILH